MQRCWKIGCLGVGRLNVQLLEDWLSRSRCYEDSLRRRYRYICVTSYYGAGICFHTDKQIHTVTSSDRYTHVRNKYVIDTHMQETSIFHDDSLPC
jgi:hypothetical protein